MHTHIITIGDEILIGQVIDTNSAWMGQQLNAVGIEVTEISTVSDTRNSIYTSLQHAAERADIILLTGGLGPTKDDITKKVLAEYFGVDLVFNEEMWARLQGFFKQLGREANESHREQCYLPANCTMLTNEMGTAPGMWFEKNGKVYVSMPGVPYEMKYLMEHEVIPKLITQFRTQPIVHRTILTSGKGESEIANLVADIEEGLPDFVKLAYLPSLAKVRLRLTARGEDEGFLNDFLNKKVVEIENKLGDLIFGYEDETLELVLGELCKEKNVTIGTLESCTGGLVAHRITSVAGASAYFKGSIIAYSNELKTNLLGVKEETLAADGAVSEATVIEMVQGGLKTLNTDYAIAVSGIAGPTGGTPEKPVGTIWVAVGNHENVKAVLVKGTKNRLKNIERTTGIALNILRKFILKY
ncbi:MAG: competence/damage-inducible protein A [Saprospiraceae bacterium]